MSGIKGNRFVRRIQSATGQADPNMAIKEFVARFRNAGETLEQLSGKLGITDITVARIGFDGGIFRDGSGLRIKLNSEIPPKRRRFTLAHELAHLMIASGNVGKARRSGASTELERACDALAAELLLPADEIKRAASDEASTETLLALADRFGASLHATAVRVKELRLWEASIGQWSWDGKAHELWFVGKRFWPEKLLYLSTFDLAVRQGAHRGSELVESLGKGVFPVLFDARRLGRDKLYVISTLSRARRSATC